MRKWQIAENKRLAELRRLEGLQRMREEKENQEMAAVEEEQRMVARLREEIEQAKRRKLEEEAQREIEREVRELEKKRLEEAAAREAAQYSDLPAVTADEIQETQNKAYDLYNQALAKRDGGNTQAAAEILEDAVELLIPLCGRIDKDRVASPEVKRHTKIMLSKVHVVLGLELQSLAQYRDAMEDFDAARALRLRLFDEQSLEVAETLMGLAHCEKALALYEDASMHYTQVIKNGIVRIKTINLPRTVGAVI
jgi:tetratricopeptide (TPR) repeat protein